MVCSGCGRKLNEVYDTYEREVRDLPCFEFRTTVVIELYRVRRPAPCTPLDRQSGILRQRLTDHS